MLEVFDARTGSAGDGKDADDPLVLEREDGELGQQIDLVQHDRLRPLVQPGSVERELTVDRAEALLDVLLRRVDHVQEQPCAFQMGEELVPEPDPLAGALDQAGNVRDGELARRPATRPCPSTGARVVNG